MVDIYYMSASNYSLPTNKDLGQHWLSDLESLKSIRDLAELMPDDCVLEIGPGPGDLTKLLVEQAGSVVAVEIDKALSINLAKRFSGEQKLEIVSADIRHFDFGELPKGYKVVANIPYYLSGYLIRQLSETANPPSLCVLLVQKEVAERLAAGPGKLSLLGVTAQAYWQVSTGPIIPAYLFSPPPKVDSRIVSLRRLEQMPFPASQSEQFFRLVNLAFNQRRKTLANSLRDGLKLDKQAIYDYLLAAGIKPTERPQELSLEDWAKLTAAIFTDRA